MSKFNFKRIAMGLAISTMFSSCFVSNVVGMENIGFEEPPRVTCNLILDSLKSLINDVNVKYDKLKKEKSWLTITDSSYFNDQMDKIIPSIVFLYQFKNNKDYGRDLGDQIKSMVNSLKDFKKKACDLHFFRLDAALQGQTLKYNEIFCQ